MKAALRLLQDDEAEATSLERLVAALERHGFNATVIDAEFRDENDELGLEVLRFDTSGRCRHCVQKRFGQLVTEFYSSAHVIPTDHRPGVQLSVKEIQKATDAFDRSVDDELEFELTFRGLDTLVMIPPVMFQPGERRIIIMEHLAKFDRFAAFLEHRPID